MADVASLVVRVKADGVDQAAKGLDGLSKSANSADKAASSFSKQADTAGKASSSFGTKAQQAGFQVQDMVVQLQGGTSAFVAISQQVPQFLGAFGPIGAVTGTVVALAAAIGGVLYKSMGDATLSAEELKEANKNLAAVLRETDSGTVVLTDSILKLAEANEQAARATLAVAMADAQTQIKGAQQAAEAAATSIDSFFSSINAAGSLENATRELENYRAAGHSTEQALIALGDTTTSTYANLGATANFTARLSEELGITTSEALGLTDALSGVTKLKTPEALQAAANQATALASASGYTNEAMNALAGSLQKAYLDMLRGVEASEALKGALDSLGGAATKAGAEVAAASALQLEALRVQTLAGKEQVLAQAELAKKQLEAKGGFQGKDLEQAQAYIDTLAQQEISAINERQARQDASAAKSLVKQQEHSDKAADKAKKAQEKALADAAKHQSKMNQLQFESRQRAVDVTAAVDPIAKIEQERQDRLQVISEYEALETANHQVALEQRAQADKVYNEAIAAAAEERFIKQSETNELLMNSINAFEGAATSALTGVITGTQGGEEAMRSLANTILNEAVGSLVEMGVQYVKNLVIGETAATASAATAAVTGASIAAAYEPAAAAVSLATFGANAAPAAAGIASTYATTSALALTGMREQGGSMTAGKAYGMAERGKAEVIVPSGSSRARTAKQMQEIMGQNGGSGVTSIAIINQTSGRIDNVQQETDLEGRMTIIVREIVSNDMMDAGSKIAKSRRQTRGQPGL
jgi:hypothetical protein